MKKIGIITMHKLINYGSALQAYALQEIIRKMGYKCELIDYKFPNKYQADRGVSTNDSLKRKLFSYISRFIGRNPWWKKMDEFKRFWEQEFILSKSYEDQRAIFADPPIYDIYITGSDQVWNPRFMKGDSVFLLSFAPSKAKKIAFSSSFGCKKLDDETSIKYKELLSQYAHISTREEGGSLILETLLGEKKPITLDPTLLLTRNEWQYIASKEKNIFENRQYILFYFMGYAFDPRPYIYELLHFVQERTQLEIISFTPLPDDFNKNVTIIENVGPLTYLHSFENASYVITSSFHGTAFAVNYGIPLYSIVNGPENDDDRQSNLLRRLGIGNCIVPINKDFSLLNPYFDEKKVEDNLEVLRQESLNYLKTALEG